MDNRASIQKPPYDVKNTTSMYDPALSSPGSSPPSHHQIPSPGYQPGTVSPPPLSHGQGQGAAPIEHAFQGSGAGPNHSSTQPQHQQHRTGTYHEMPSVRVDGELRELP